MRFGVYISYLIDTAAVCEEDTLTIQRVCKNETEEAWHALMGIGMQLTLKLSRLKPDTVCNISAYVKISEERKTYTKFNKSFNDASARFGRGHQKL